MNLLEAIQTGKVITRTSDPDLVIETANINAFTFKKSDMLADDWEIYPHWIEISETEFDHIADKIIAKSPNSALFDWIVFKEKLKKELFK